MNDKNNRWTTNGYYGSQPAPQKQTLVGLVDYSSPARFGKENNIYIDHTLVA